MASLPAKALVAYARALIERGETPAVTRAAAGKASAPALMRGLIRLRAGRVEAAREDRRRAEASPDPWLQYAVGIHAMVSREYPEALRRFDALADGRGPAAERAGNRARYLRDALGCDAAPPPRRAPREQPEPAPSLEQLAREVDEREHPEAWLRFACAQARRGCPEIAARVFVLLRDELAPAELAWACDALAQPSYLDGGAAPRELAPILEHLAAHALLERSGPGLAELHRRDDELIAHAWQTIGGALGLRAPLPYFASTKWTVLPAPNPRVRLGTPRAPIPAALRPRPRERIEDVCFAGEPSSRGAPVLDDDALARFVSEGYVRVPACFDRAWAQARIARAVAQIRADPSASVERCPANHGLEQLDPAHARSVALPYFSHVEGEGYDAAAVMPRLWRAIFELLGPSAEPKTTRWAANFKVNLFPREASAQASSDSVHVDHPPGVRSLREITNGLIGVMLFSDVEAGGGGTLAIPGSAGVVARALAEGPLDLDDQATGRALAAACTRAPIELTGEVGDVFLLHPLTLHGTTPNFREQPRWMVNPLIELERAIDLAAAPPSPVARLILAALA
ncbi:phytanoyl-CoA dioxygenase family protein [Pseudenhygromyxa sp. WMMC2535]|uniref:phytanoyl-CoA dioxygenase family protein n=1 Tax=Pseudenhygromyxa sp. WMMC2535 TaxID=2712867 RepID=UPI0015570C0F|nr:phytanoyl-CoA dioxygenase family protein [Pseudenhygromyxa sp. WMMC2535]NVB36892.1 phytanoyl-CoA dioxygenase family protein [Pseudenhygromyxa sp. WMMC2535]